ncbi:MAG: PA-phosphatase, partial [Deinococcales bacterium]|nr:PA-phosphatase [Chitinophagaceae bacterium]
MQLLKNKYSLAIIFAILVISCNKGITERTIPDFEPTTTDALGGSWKTIVLTDGSEPMIAAPDAVTSAAYQAELTNITQLQNNLTTTDKQLIDDWKSSGIIKWNTLARELVAKYNLPPEANADGTYPVPSAANPAGYPKFPFANPPYASRAYAYLHVAIYDALVSCWKYKYQYNRKAPSTNDSKIKTLETIRPDLPSYPSEDAVVAQVSFRLLKTFFPLDSALQLQMANNQKKAKL